ncbi:hypothetical protein [Sorangium sp. So ce388]|uniref:hypothetical protein n=1 Tax=Sorangium sp. So ce388 TaxID=3133309 RepID=UPI003F5B899E
MDRAENTEMAEMMARDADRARDALGEIAVRGRMVRSPRTALSLLGSSALASGEPPRAEVLCGACGATVGEPCEEPSLCAAVIADPELAKPPCQRSSQ